MPQQNPEISSGLETTETSETREKPEEQREKVKKASENEREELVREIGDLKTPEKAFSYIEKENFNEAKVREMLNISRNMSVYDLWRGGIARMKNEEGLKENQGFDRMAAQFAKRKVDENGRAYLEINLHTKSKFEMNIGAGHICPPSWKRVAIVDLEGNVRVGERRVPGKDNVRGGKIGYFDDQGRYLVVFSGYKVYPLSVLSDGNENDKKIINEQTEKESTFYRENKEEIEKYVIREASYNVNRAEMSRVEIQRIRDQISGLEEIKDPGERVAAVAKWIHENEKIHARHCYNWVERVYAIAGVQGKRVVYRNLDYARHPDGRFGAGRDAREGMHAVKERPNLVDNLKPGTWVWLNNRNTSDVAGNHSVIFVGWQDKERRIALCAEWINASTGGQRIRTYDFNRIPVVSIEVPTQVEDRFERLSPEEIARESRSSRVETQSGLKLRGRGYAFEVQEKYGVPWQVTYAMFILESGAGRSNLARNENAYFGIKARREAPNATRLYGGSRYRSYLNMRASFLDYGRTVTRGRYSEAVRYKNNPMMFLAVILNAGYCPDADYFRKIVRIWRREGIRDIGYISQKDLEKSLRRVAHRGRRVDSYVEGLRDPARLEREVHSVARENNVLRA